MSQNDLTLSLSDFSMVRVVQNEFLLYLHFQLKSYFGQIFANFLSNGPLYLSKESYTFNWAKILYFYNSKHIFILKLIL